MRAAKRWVKVLNECKKMTEAQNRHRDGMANMPVEIYLTRVRSLKERRAAAKIRVLSRKDKL